MIEILLQAEHALSLGLLDRAEILYRQVAGADPRNSIAVVGLARVSLERGDQAGALKQASRALAIDPENAAARRMVQRLEEILAFRGERIPTEAPAPPVDSAPPVQPASPVETPPVQPPQPLPAMPASDAAPVAPEPGRRSFLKRLLRRR